MEIFGEITSASGFEYDNIFIRYFIDLPSGKFSLSKVVLLSFNLKITYYLRISSINLIVNLYKVMQQSLYT